ncbi:sterol desaturase family protein [Empedobacter sp. GD03861]|uniref:sterol desaturase family protein n=1 Tax=Empedobacter sp. GD03861 TaxID=2975390 RepID=UPI00244D5B18|nr:sterol desaturase family protein [Empedobacter sp. GD03861]MDH0675494.1 sterol desaturase family protein [Empedobacter sp. GD03861]
MKEKSYLLYVLFMAARYFFFSGMTFLLFYVIFRKNVVQLKIQKLFPKDKDYKREIQYSILTMFIFAGFAYLLSATSFWQYTRIYRDFNEHSIGYFIFSVVLAILIHDTYFYWMHRLMHHPKVFKYVHLVHHKSTNPSPFTSYSFHPFEAVVEAAVILVIVFLIPIHKFAIGLFLLFMIVFNIYGHLGYEIFPKWLLQSSIGKWFNTSLNHNMHHKYFNDNYGLYFRFWDEWCGTTHPDYQKKMNQMLHQKS